MDVGPKNDQFNPFLGTIRTFLKKWAVIFKRLLNTNFMQKN